MPSVGVKGGPKIGVRGEKRCGSGEMGVNRYKCRGRRTLRYPSTKQQRDLALPLPKRENIEDRGEMKRRREKRIWPREKGQRALEGAPASSGEAGTQAGRKGQGHAGRSHPSTVCKSMKQGNGQNSSFSMSGDCLRYLPTYPTQHTHGRPRSCRLSTAPHPPCVFLFQYTRQAPTHVFLYDRTPYSHHLPPVRALW